jgi:RND family efflux transporter MFP subunit
VTPDTTLTTVSQSRSLELSINIPLEQAPQIQLGMPIQVLNNQNKLIGSSQITFVAPDADPQTQSILVKATYDNSQGTLRADQFVRTRVVWQQRPALVIPLTAVSRVAGQNFVYVVQPGEAPAGGPPSLIAVQKPVRLGEIQGNTYEVIAGLEVNQQIVASGLQKIFDQAPIMDESQMPPPPPGGAPPP